MTLNCYTVSLNSRGNSQDFADLETTTAKRMKIDPYCQRQNCSPLMYFSTCIHYVDIAGHSAAGGRQTRAEWGKQAIFEVNASISRKR